ncbi:MAG TPA: sugar transferase [Longimicrobium sp.]|jgi:exopolysaccharide biosynthesis polyprenyl glycosylphosphotransferase|uniref:sugar transferase n=1 Tax=Longimicrobium sp. TaxID=2029185 RepID=UPI002ED8D642
MTSFSQPVVQADSAVHRTGGRAFDARPLQMVEYDVRLRREITHRRLAVSLARRVLRVVTLHSLDALLVGATALLLAMYWGVGALVTPLIPALVGVFLLSLNALATYHPGDGRRDEGRLASASVLAVLLLSLLSVFPPRLGLSVQFLVSLAAGAFVVLALGRMAADRVVRLAYARGIGLRRAVLVGSLYEVGQALRDLRDDRNVDQYVVGHLSVDGSDPAAMGTVADLPALLDLENVQEVLVATLLPAHLMREVTQACFQRGAAVYVRPSVLNHVDCWAEPTRVGEVPVMRLHPTRFEFPTLMVKRMVDVLGSTVLLLLAAPLLALIALAIRLDSPGPVFFRQTRVGLGGRRFTIWKFRSMAIDAERRLAELEHLNLYGRVGPFKLANDPRITRVGGWLRRTSMDELPQLFNVLKGDMSLVGPRPLPPSDLDRMEPGHYFDRLSVVPGLTGPWQVNGRNRVTDFEKILKMERDYIAHWSLLVDLKILFRTVAVVVRGDGAI